MSVIYEALKKAQRADLRREKIPSPLFDRTEEFLYVGNWMPRKRWLSLSTVGLALVLLGALGALVYYLSQDVHDSIRKYYFGERATNYLGATDPADIDADAKKRLAQSAYDNGNIAKAVEIWELLVAVSPDALLYKRLGLAHKKLGHLDQAESYYLKAIPLDPDSAVLLNNIASLYIDQGRFGDAQAYLLRATALDSDYADPYFHIGRLREREGRVSEAITAYRDFLVRHHDDTSEFSRAVNQRILELERPQ